MSLRKQGGLKILAAVAGLLLFTLQPVFAMDELPIADILSRSFQFEPVADGQEVLHDFVLVNRGAAPLNISKVRTG